MNAFESMTDLPEWLALIRDWRLATEQRAIRELGQRILQGDDITASRQVACTQGILKTLAEFDRYVASQTARPNPTNPVSEKIRRSTTRKE